MVNQNGSIYGFRLRKQAFTLVELIIVITILAILATIAFMSFSNYTKSSRDANRLSTLTSVEKGLRAFQIGTGKYPIPENAITLSSGIEIGQQGEIGPQISQLIKISNTPVDILDRNNFTYSVNKKGNIFQVGGFLENPPQISLINASYASNLNYSERFFTSAGDTLGILLVNTGSNINTPLQKFYNTVSFTGIEIKTFTGTLSNGVHIGELKVVFDNTPSNTISGTGETLVSLENSFLEKMGIIMTNCPNGWSDKGVFGGELGRDPIVTTLSGNHQNYRVCQKN